ncbi:MAG: hypothetical protein COB04_00895 [Gammaproteobacteria bacterium]|nr:MAG: hypothetical protein COB04_00895 [Gammaproteobacteria bacterium]
MLLTRHKNTSHNKAACWLLLPSKLGCAFLLILLTTSPTFASDFSTDPTTRTTHFTDTDPKIALGPNLQYLAAKNNDWTIDDILQARNAMHFRDTGSDVPNLGLSAKSHWFRLKIKYDGTKERISRVFGIEFAQLAEIDFYVLDKAGDYRLVKGGFLRPQNSPEIKSRHFAATLEFNPGETQWIYFKVLSQGPLILPTYLWDPEARFQQQRSQLILYGAYYGIILAMFIYNLFLYLWMRSNSYLFYVLYIGCIGVGLSINDGILKGYLLENNDWVNMRLLYFLACAGIISAMQFCRLMLNAKDDHPTLNNAMLVTMAYGAFTGLLTLVHISIINVILVTILIVAAALTTLITSALRMYEGYRGGGFFCFAWSILCISFLVFTLLNIGLLPFNSFTANVQYIGSALEIILLSFFLADRINTTTLEKLAIEQVAKEELERSLINLNNSHRLKSDFFATVSHELRTPMNGVVGMLDLMSNTKLDKEQATHVDVAIKFARLMMYFVDNLLGFAQKTESNRVILRSFRLRESLDNIRLRFLARCHSQGLTFQYNIADNVPNQLIGDSSRLQGVITHLLDNAIKFTDHGVINLNVSCTANHNDHNKTLVNFFVIDTGKGISKTQLNNIFDPFSDANAQQESPSPSRPDTSSSVQTKNGDTQHKLGIGLSLCKKSADVMEADITIKSQVGKGTEVQFLVPLDIDDKENN